MQRMSWTQLEAEPMNERITRRMLHGAHVTVARFHLARGAVVPRHAHTNEQFTNVLAGALKFVFDDGEVVARAGDVVVIGSNEPHAAEALEDTDVLDVFAPRREDWIRKDDAYLRGS